MEWWLVVIAASFLSLALGLSVGMFLPRGSMFDYFLNYFMLIAIFVIGVAGIMCLGWGIRK